VKQLAYVGFKVVDENGFIVDSVTFEEEEEFEIQPNWISELVPNFYKPKWDFEQKKWIEGATQEEIDEIENRHRSGVSLKQQLTNTENTLLSIMDTMIEKGGIS